MMYLPRTWPVGIPLLTDESCSSWFARIAWAHGVEPSEACERLNREFQDAEIAFDTGPAAHDAEWLSILYKAASMEQSFALTKLSSDLCILG